MTNVPILGTKIEIESLVHILDILEIEHEYFHKYQLDNNLILKTEGFVIDKKDFCTVFSKIKDGMYKGELNYIDHDNDNAIIASVNIDNIEAIETNS